MKRKLVTIMMTMALATTLVACKNTDTNAEANSEPISNSEFVMQNAELETKEPTELETKESKEVESKETTEATKETETEATKETESTESKEVENKEETSNKEETTKKEENTTSSNKEDTSKTEDTSKKNEVKNDTSKKEDTSSKKEESNTNTSQNDTPKNEEPKNEEVKKNEASSNTEVNNNTSNNNSNNANTEASNNTPAPAPTPEPVCTHPQTYINSGMFLRRESLGGGCYKDIEAAEDVCLTCGAVVRSYERVGQEVHANMKRISGDAKAPTCTEGGYDNTVTACDCGSETHTNNYTEPAYGHAYHDDCTGDISEDKTKVRYITVCYRCGDVANEWWE